MELDQEIKAWGLALLNGFLRMVLFVVLVHLGTIIATTVAVTTLVRMGVLS